MRDLHLKLWTLIKRKAAAAKPKTKKPLTPAQHAERVAAGKKAAAAAKAKKAGKAPAPKKATTAKPKKAAAPRPATSAA